MCGDKCIHIHDARRPLDDKLLASEEDKEEEKDPNTSDDAEVSMTEEDKEEEKDPNTSDDAEVSMTKEE